MTNSTQFPFMLDAEKMKDMFKMPELDKMFEPMKMPHLDMESMIAAQQKNIQALVEANKAAMTGYQELYKHQVAMIEESMAKAKDQLGEMQGQPMSPDQMSRNMENLKGELDKVSDELKKMAEMAQKANTDAFNIVKSRFEEGLEEFKTAAEKMSR